MHELVPGAFVLEESARKGRRHGDGVRFLDAAHGHAGVHGLDDHGDAPGMQGILDAVADLLGQALLDLQAAGVSLYDAGDLGKSRDLSVGDVGDMGLPDERQHVVLAQGEEFDVLDDDHLVVGLVENGGLHDGSAILSVTLCQELPGLGHPFGRFDESLPLRILSEQFQNGLYMSCELFCRLFVVFFYLSVRHGIVFVANGLCKIGLQN